MLYVGTYNQQFTCQQQFYARHAQTNQKFGHVDRQHILQRCLIILNIIHMSDIVCHDFGLSEIAAHLGKTSALETYYEGSLMESSGDVQGAIALYRRAYRMWPGTIDLNRTYSVWIHV